jgi:hypothetical protein
MYLSFRQQPGVSRGLPAGLIQASMAQAQDRQRLEKARGNAVTNIVQDAAAFGLKAMIVLPPSGGN